MRYDELHELTQSTYCVRNGTVINYKYYQTAWTPYMNGLIALLYSKLALPHRTLSHRFDFLDNVRRLLFNFFCMKKVIVHKSFEMIVPSQF